MITFDDLSGGDQVTNQYLGEGVLFEGDLGVAGPSIWTNPVSGSNSVFYDDPNGVLASFFAPGSGEMATTDYVAFTPTDASHYLTSFKMYAYDISGLQIGFASTIVESTGVYLASEDPKVSISVAGIHSVLLTGNLTTSTGNYGIEGDNFEFGSLTPITAVPLPGAVWLMLSGLMVLIAGRRKG